MSSMFASRGAHADSRQALNRTGSGSINVGDVVQVYTCTLKRWIDARVVELGEDSLVQVEYVIASKLLRKNLFRHSDCIKLPCEECDPECNFANMTEAFEALEQNVKVKQEDGSRLSVQRLGLEEVQNNSFATRRPLKSDCTIEFVGSDKDDVLLKVYALGTQHSRTDYELYDYKDYTHAMQKPRKPTRVAAGCFLGLTIHKDLNKDWIWKIKEEEPERFEKFLNRDFFCGHGKRGDIPGTRISKQADYLISFTTGNKQDNDYILQSFSSAPVKGPHGERKITFCTDRSLGLGNHFSSEAGLDVYIAKHGFAQSTQPGAWLEDYKTAATETRHGLLILNFTQEYLRSKACRKEFGFIDLSKINIYVATERLIVPWSDLKSNPEVCRKALGPYNRDVLDPVLLAQEAASLVDDEDDGKQQEAWCALPLYEITLALLQAEKGRQDIPIAEALFNVGRIYLKVGWCGDAKHALEKALKIKEQHYGPDHVEVARTLGNLASAHGDLGDIHTKKRMLERELKIQKQHYRPDHFQVALTLGNLANAHGGLGDVHTKKRMLERALKIEEQHFGPDHFQVAPTRGNLANAHGDLGDIHTMKRMLERALKIQEQHFGPDHFQVADSLNNLANAHGDLGDIHTQKRMLERALKIKEQHYGPDHLEVACTLGNLANVHGDLGDVHTKKRMLERALKIEEQHYRPDHFQVALTLGNLANAHGDLGDVRTKKRMLERALKIQEQHFGPYHFQVADSLNDLANAHGGLGDVHTKKRMLERALKIKEQHYAPDHFQVAVTLFNLANVHGDLGDVHIMKRMLERALKIEEQHYGPDHCQVAQTLGVLARVHGDLGDIYTKERMLERALKIKEKH